ncbi:type II toxin-antitoxin system RelE/ParE family toxin [Paraburkholderia megapolitana]|uniref:Putative addiction module killer protein n=1 Tax=Paraburkholderia megapolitana TaxID=420953 RepID=A0A1I3RMV7_9BURK|nr:type II toxin-antitoxin system RelE/ParE family toxin [Paraburkholderia megapolitana]QDQ83943.1 type II toxin-antitoxin system RelE/ParE family toxin [Paraburkholderia megapolitana]SFJ47192.1 putative addiction module killer protein [Paraburkholderia megapolitana]
MRIEQTEVFVTWMRGLRDGVGRANIVKRIERLGNGNTGDVKAVGAGVIEMRIHYGPGYRVYYTQRGNVLVVLLCGGDKSTQQRDIEQAIRLAAELEK